MRTGFAGNRERIAISSWTTSGPESALRTYLAPYFVANPGLVGSVSSTRNGTPAAPRARATPNPLTSPPTTTAWVTYLRPEGFTTIYQDLNCGSKGDRTLAATR